MAKTDAQVGSYTDHVKSPTTPPLWYHIGEGAEKSKNMCHRSTNVSRGGDGPERPASVALGKKAFFRRWTYAKHVKVWEVD